MYLFIYELTVDRFRIASNFKLLISDEPLFLLKTITTLLNIFTLYVYFKRDTFLFKSGKDPINLSQYKSIVIDYN